MHHYQSALFCFSFCYLFSCPLMEDIMGEIPIISHRSIGSSAHPPSPWLSLGKSPSSPGMIVFLCQYSSIFQLFSAGSPYRRAQDAEACLEGAIPNSRRPSWDEEAKNDLYNIFLGLHPSVDIVLTYCQDRLLHTAKIDSYYGILNFHSQFVRGLREG